MASDFEATARARFPALQKDQVYFDNAGGSQTLDAVIDSVKDYLTNSNVQLGATYSASKNSTSLYSNAYKRAAEYINASEDEIVFSASSTQLLRNLSYSLKLEPGDEIVVSMTDHEANITPWLDLAERQNLIIQWWRPSTNYTGIANCPELTPANLSPLLCPRTKLVACTHCSNVLGTVNNIKQIAEAAHQVGALVCVDGVAYAPHRRVDVKELGADFYVLSWYKVYGPHISMLYASWTAQMNLRSLGHQFKPSTTLANKLGLAGDSYELLQAIPHVVDYLNPQNYPFWDKLIAHEERLQSALLEYLVGLPNSIIYGTTANTYRSRVPTLSFTIEGWNSKEVVEAIEAKTNLCLRSGTMYSDRLVRDVLGEN